MSGGISARQRWFRRMTKLVLLGLILTGMILAWPKPILEVVTAPVARGSVEDVVPSLQAGNVKGKRQVTLRATTIGKVDKLLVQRGDRVLEGQMLVELESASLLARLRLAQANLAAGESAIRTADLRRGSIKRNLDRTSQLTAKGVLASEALERVQDEFKVSGEVVSSAQAGLEELRAAVHVAATSLEDTRIRAPFGGLVVSLLVEKGESLMVGAPVLELVDDSAISVEATVDEADAGKLKTGMPARIHSDAFPGQPFLGNLTWISPVVVKDLKQNRRLDVEIGLNGQTSLLKVGMSIDVEIIVNSRDNTLFVPTSAIMRNGDTQQVYVVQNGRARLRSLRPGLSNWERTEILEGLREGEPILLSPGEKDLREGVRVRAPGTNPGTKVAY